MSAYATLAEYKAYISIRGLNGAVSSDTSDDDVIELMLLSASRYIDRETGRRFYADANDTVYYFTAEEAYEMSLPDFASISSVSVDYNNTRSYTALTASDWEALPDNYSAEGLPIRGLAILPTSAAWFPTSRRGVKVTGKRGWASAPSDITDSCLAIVHNIYSARSGQMGAGKMTITGGGIVIRPSDVPDFAEKVIANYRMMT